MSEYEVRMLIESGGILRLENQNAEEKALLWKKAVEFVTEKNVSKLLESIGYSLVGLRPFTESEGMINETYLVRALDDKAVEQDLILKILSPDKRFLKRKANEAALINYLKAHTSIPVPNVLSYSNNQDSSMLRCRYILMEKAAGTLLKYVLPKSAADLPISLINQMLDIIRQLKALKPFKQELIGCFDVDEETNTPVLIPSFPKEKLYANYFESWNEAIQFYIREMRKLVTHCDVADLLDEKRRLLIERIEQFKEKNPNADLNDQLYITHGDLNDTNIIVDPETLNINCIIDWEWSEYSISDDLSFGENWYEDEGQRQESEYVQALIKSALLYDENRELHAISKQNCMTFFKEYLSRVQLAAHFACDLFYRKPEDGPDVLVQNAKQLISNCYSLQEILLNFDNYMNNAFK